MSLTSRSNNIGPVGNRGGSLWTPANARLAIKAGQQVARTILDSANGWSQGTGGTQTVASGTKRRGGRGNRKKVQRSGAGSIPRGVVSSSASFVLTGTVLMANNSAGLTKIGYPLQVPIATDPFLLFDTSIIGPMDFKIVQAFRYMKVHKINMKFTSYLGRDKPGYHTAGFRSEFMGATEVQTPELIANCYVNKLSSIHEPIELTYVPTKNKGIARNYSDASQQSIDADERHVGYVLYWNDNTEVNAARTGVMSFNCTVSLWNDSRN